MPIDVDVYYHLGVAREMLQQGPLESFPWTPHSYLADQYADKEVLFHVFLMPLTGMDVVSASAWGALLGQLFFVAVFCACLWRLRTPAAWLFPILLSTLGAMLAMRFSACRPQTWGAACSVLVVSLLVGRARLRWLVVAAVVYSWCHTGGWISIFYAAVWVACGYLSGERRDAGWCAIGATALGWALGQTLHPNFPDTFRLAFIQNVLVPFHASPSGDPVLRAVLGVELRASQWETLAQHKAVYGLLLCMGAGLALHGPQRTRESLAAFAIAGSLALAATLLMGRLFELAAPCTALAAAVVWRDRITYRRREEGEGRWPWELRPSFLVPSLALMLANTAWAWHTYLAEPPKIESPIHMARWLGAHARPEERVFTAQWAHSALLFYFAPQVTSLVALDPTFFYVRDPELFERYVRIAVGMTNYPVDEIRQRFQSRYVVTQNAEHVVLDAQLRNDPRARLVHDDLGFRVWDIGGAEPMVRPTSVQGLRPGWEPGMDG